MAVTGSREKGAQETWWSTDLPGRGWSLSVPHCCTWVEFRLANFEHQKFFLNIRCKRLNSNSEFHPGRDFLTQRGQFCLRAWDPGSQRLKSNNTWHMPYSSLHWKHHFQIKRHSPNLSHHQMVQVISDTVNYTQVIYISNKQTTWSPSNSGTKSLISLKQLNFLNRVSKRSWSLMQPFGAILH